MIDDSQIRGLEKLLNSDIIKNIYPVIDKIEVHNSDNPFEYLENTLHLNIYLNNPEANKENLWDKFNFDEHYLVDHHVRNLLPYLSIDNDKTSIRFRVYDANFDVIITNDI
jgi:hypothetical protein